MTLRRTGSAASPIPPPRTRDPERRMTMHHRLPAPTEVRPVPRQAAPVQADPEQADL